VRDKHRRKRQHPGVRRRTPPGTAPGTLTPVPGSPHPSIRVIAFGDTQFVEQSIENLEDLREIRQRYAVTWVDVEGLGDVAAVQRLGEIFGLHFLALEDVVNTHQRAKVDHYENHLFVIARMVSFPGHLDTEQIALFLGRDFVVTFQHKPGDCLDPVRERLQNGQCRLRKAGADYLAYALLDAIIDGYFPVLDQYTERLERLDEEIAHGDPRQMMVRIHELRVELLELRRAIWPHREALSALARDPSPLVGDETRLHLRDCLDHVVTIIDLTETYREMCSDLRDYFLAMVSTRMNEIMKVLTVIATLFMPLTFIAGVYGMNFSREHSEWNMPELWWTYGYPFALGLMAAVAAGMLFYFWRKGWLWSSLPPEPPGGTRPNHDNREPPRP